MIFSKLSMVLFDIFSTLSFYTKVRLILCQL
nr:MAG TPA: hypothetical protein [Caudoviricetes sp.]